MILKLQKGIKSYIDKEDWDKISKLHWWFEGRYVANFKSYRDGKLKRTKKILLHRFILGLDKDNKSVVDHIDRNPLNNRKNNLRICTQVENQQNRIRVQSNNTSGYRGVSWFKPAKLWFVQGHFRGKRVWTKYYKTFDEAVVGRKEFEKKYFIK